MLVTAFLAVAEEHAQEHVGPVLGLGAAGAGIDTDNGGTGVVLAREHAGKLHLGDRGLQGRNDGTDLLARPFIRPFFAQLTQQEEIVGLGPSPITPFHKFLQRGSLAQQLLCLIATIPKTGFGNLGIKLGNTLLLPLYVKGTSSARRACCVEY